MPRAAKEREADKRARLANHIRRQRELKGFTNAEKLSKELGIGIHKVWEYENGLREPPVTVAIVLANKLGCTVEDLYRPYVERLPKR